MAVMYGAVVIYWGQTHSEPCCPGLFPVDRLLTLAGFLLCMKPANIVIRSCLSSLNLYDPSENENDLEKAGRWIGSIERIMAMVLVMLQQYTAIGFIIAAKSVLRYNDKKTGKTEYVLIGTLLSFGIAILIGIGIEKGFFEALLKYAADLWQ